MSSFVRTDDAQESYSNSRAGFQCNRIHGVIRTDDEGDISVLEVIVDFVHFEHDLEKRAVSLSV